jgi:hypothetical protein
VPYVSTAIFWILLLFSFGFEQGEQLATGTQVGLLCTCDPTVTSVGVVVGSTVCLLISNRPTLADGSCLGLGTCAQVSKVGTNG